MIVLNEFVAFLTVVRLADFKTGEFALPGKPGGKVDLPRIALV
jgi:hypothetical protein